MKIAIYGYGNLGKGVECAVHNACDAELVGVFTRRDPEAVKTLTGAAVYKADDLPKFKGKIDVVIICGGSATDLPKMTPALAKDFCVVDSFDTHAKIPQHFENVDEAAKAAGTVAVISAGWDPGMFSINRLYASAILPNGNDYTFWGRGVSQGHSDAIRRIEGVVDARQYTVPVEEALAKVRSGENPTLTTRQKHTRECFVVAEEGADLEEIRRKIVEMPNYFADYDTTVTFVTLEELRKNHSALPHGGRVIRTGKTGLNNENSHCIEYSLQLDSNPEFTASVLLACARAADKLCARGESGCKTMFDIAPADLSDLSGAELRKTML
ncbi:MAG: diaminopimelate dehydrogenase [Oscillospiraceae bacterium]|nr:diaminopimelate dehydrogenase [Oscillospiraceae bacterium]